MNLSKVILSVFCVKNIAAIGLALSIVNLDAKISSAEQPAGNVELSKYLIVNVSDRSGTIILLDVLNSSPEYLEYRMVDETEFKRVRLSPGNIPTATIINLLPYSEIVIRAISSEEQLITEFKFTTNKSFELRTDEQRKYLPIVSSFRGSVELSDSLIASEDSILLANLIGSSNYPIAVFSDDFRLSEQQVDALFDLNNLYSADNEPRPIETNDILVTANIELTNNGNLTLNFARFIEGPDSALVPTTDSTLDTFVNKWLGQVCSIDYSREEALRIVTGDYQLEELNAQLVEVCGSEFLD
ncbi:MAG: hypothetical protein HWE27_00190 [Gammaproteobacteria bacterium]|nr:hypothetical protein [Gammaproteobacteria bacterium]